MTQSDFFSSPTSVRKKKSDEVSHWCPQHFEALLGCGQSLVASPHHRLWIMHPRSCRETCHPCGLNATGIPQFGFTQMNADACRSSVSNNWNNVQEQRVSHLQATSNIGISGPVPHPLLGARGAPRQNHRPTRTWMGNRRIDG